jgi:signal transduction histidine kinase
MYEYEDTKQLVMLVEDAASLIEQKGDKAFNDFAENGSKWLNDRYYLFVYDIYGKCVFHPIEPNLVGQDLSQFKDISKRPVIAMIVDVGKKQEPGASDWVFYLWEEPWKSPTPEWKSSYIRKAILPDGNVYLVGSGLYNMKMEKIFLEENVDTAAELILTKGKDAGFAELQDPSCPLHILDSYIIVSDSNGNVLVDPSFPGLNKKRNILNFCDKTGRYITKETINGLRDKDRMWILYIWPKNNPNQLARHLAYTRKVKVGDEVFYVGSDFTPATPIWMKQ